MAASSSSARTSPSPSSASSETAHNTSTDSSGGDWPVPKRNFNLIPASTPVYRRMAPEEDLVATLLGIDVLVRQRQELIDRLVAHHQRLARKNEIGTLVHFSREIDRIMKLRGLAVMTPDVSRNRRQSRFSTLEWDEFHLREMEGGAGIRSIQEMLRKESLIDKNN